MRTKQINIRLDRDLVEAYQALADADDRDRTYFMKIALKEYLSKSAPKAVKKVAPKFVRPSIDEVRSYISSKRYPVDVEAWYAFYESNGWKVGKNPMKDWQAAVRTWAKNSKQVGYQTAQEKRAQRNSQIFDYEQATTF